MKKRDEVLNSLNRLKKHFSKQYGVSEIGIFGSLARNENTERSDVDIVIKMEKPDLFYLVHIKEELETEYSSKVDIVQYRETMNPFLKKRIDQEAVYV